MQRLLRFAFPLAALGLSFATAQAQTPGAVGIGTSAPDASALLDLSSTAKGFLAPRMTASERTNIQNPAQGLLVYQTDGVQLGFWYYTGAAWTYLSPTSSGDNLGNHTATQNLNLGTHLITGGGTTGLRMSSNGYVGLGGLTPSNWLDVQSETRTGSHATGRALYVTGPFNEAFNGVEFRHSNGTQGVGIGHNSLYAAGTNANQHLNLMPKGTGGVGIGTTAPAAKLDVPLGSVRLPGGGGDDTWFNFPGNNQNYLRGTTILADLGGSVGIGTGTPAQKLDVVGNVQVSGAGNGLLFPDGTKQTTAAVGITPQTLSINGQTLSISGTGGNSVTLPVGADNLGNHTATQNLNLADKQLVGNGGSQGLSISSSGSVGVGTTGPNAKAALDVTSTTKGFLPPRLTTTQRDAMQLTTSEIGLTIYNTNSNKLEVWNGTGWTESLAAVPQAAATFGYTGGAQTYTVPAGVTRITVVASGAAGGNYPSGSIAAGGRVQATLTVLPGEVLTVQVGGQGGSAVYNSNAYNGGGTSYAAGAGGGATDLRRSAANGGTGDYSTSRNALLVAGGGGGGNGVNTGGGGGTPNGGSGQASSSANWGGGGTQSSVGRGGGNFFTGTLGNDGNGPQGGNAGNYGGGGGGGYYGGGGGGSSPGYVGGGGGGSSWVAASGSNVSYGTGSTGHGSLSITPGTVVDGSNVANVPGTWQTNGSTLYHNAGNVGIGTASPGQKLEVAGQVFSSTGGFRFPDNTVQTTAASVQTLGISGQTLSISRGNSITLPVDNLGNHTATTTLNMNGNAVSFGTSTRQHLNLFNADYGIGVQAGTEYFRTGESFAWFVGGAHSNTQFDAGGGTVSMVLKSGKLGIGTASPISALDVPTGTVHLPGDSWINYYGDNRNYLRGTTILADVGGYVGIGTSSPSYPLDVNGSATPGNFTYGYLNSGGAGGNATSTGPISIRASHRILATEFNATSDRRLKSIIGLSDKAADLALLNRIRITDYTMRDRVQYGQRQFKKVIAQEVEQVFPQAVSQHQGFLPDIYAAATQVETQADSLLTLTLPTAPATDPKAGQRVKLIGKAGEVVGIVKAANGNRLVVRGARQLAGQEVFVFGLEHTDVRTVDYEALSMLNVSATQELARQVAELQKQNARLQAELAASKTQAAQQVQQVKAEATAQAASLDQRLKALESLLGARAEAK